MLSTHPEVASLSKLSSALNALIPAFRWSKDLNLKLERISALVHNLGDPQLKYPTVHVGGTSGKGTVAAMTAAILSSSGNKVGLHLSPYVQTLTETWQIDGRYALPSQVLPIAENIIAAGAPISESLPFGPPSYFETKVAPAFQLFLESGVDVAVIEVGLGGALDATNVIGPGVKVLTSVSLDHTEILGDTVEQIAKDKVQIIHPDSVAISGVEQTSVKEIVRKRCADIGATLYALDEDIRYHSDSETLVIDGGPLPITVKIPATWPDYQKRNAVMAVTAAQTVARSTLDSSIISDALASVHLPARFERFNERNVEVILDGAHNPEKMHTTAEQLQRLPGNHQIVAVLALKDSKDAQAVLSEIAPLCRSLFLTTFQAQPFQPMDPARLAGHLRGLEFLGAVTIETDPHDAIQKAFAALRDKDMLVVTGSLYLAGNVRDRWVDPLVDLLSGSSYSSK